MLTTFFSRLWRWLPALTLMGVIFVFSSFPSDDLPNFDLVDRLVKKGGHMLGYALLACSYAYALKLSPKQFWRAWVLAVLYAATDEFHQSFVPGRQASLWDVFFFDAGGAFVALWLWSRIKK